MLKVDHVVSTYTIGNTLNIKVRVKDQGSFPWVSVVCYAAYCEVTFTNTGLSGSQQVVLQSFDDNGSVKSTLKEDKIEVFFIQFSRPTAIKSAHKFQAKSLLQIEIDNLVPSTPPTVQPVVMMRE